MRPLGQGGVTAGEFPVRSLRRGSGKGRSGPRESHMTDLWLELGSGRCRQGGAAARRFPGRCSWVCRRGGGLGKQGVAQEAVVDLGWGVGMVGRPEKLVARKLGGGGSVPTAVRCRNSLQAFKLQKRVRRTTADYTPRCCKRPAGEGPDWRLEGESEWEPIKNSFSKELRLCPNRNSEGHTRLSGSTHKPLSSRVFLNARYRTSNRGYRLYRAGAVTVPRGRYP
jgi:hypothetical protein